MKRRSSIAQDLRRRSSWSSPTSSWRLKPRKKRAPSARLRMLSIFPLSPCWPEIGQTNEKGGRKCLQTARRKLVGACANLSASLLTCLDSKNRSPSARQPKLVFYSIFCTTNGILARSRNSCKRLFGPITSCSRMTSPSCDREYKPRPVRQPRR